MPEFYVASDNEYIDDARYRVEAVDEEVDENIKRCFQHPIFDHI